MDIFGHKEKRKSLGLSRRSASPVTLLRHSPKASPRLPAVQNAKLEIDYESPPLVFYGNAAHSSGALLSAQLLLTVIDAQVTLHTFSMLLNMYVRPRKPVSKDCAACQANAQLLKQWHFLSEPRVFKKGVHAFPFSYLLPGHMPVTAHSDLGKIDYLLEAQATTSTGDTIPVERLLIVQRALMPGTDRGSIRVFPPTNLTTTVQLPSVIHPRGTFPVQMRLTGVVDASRELHRRWRIRKVNWRIDETTRFLSISCPQHLHKLGLDPTDPANLNKEAPKGIVHNDLRTIGGEDLKAGWKSDFDTPGGQIELEFNAGIRSNAHAVCDVEDAAQCLSTSHALILEIIVAEEQSTPRGGRYATPTGTARVLRMQFKLILTERADLGTSWDEEMPPMYEDVPHSPPGYTRIDDYDGDLPCDEELEAL